MRRAKRSKRRAHLLNGMSHAVGKEIAITRRACAGVRHTTRSDDYVLGLLLALEASLVEIFYAIYLVVESENIAHTGVVFNLYAKLLALLHKGVGNVPRLATAGEYTLATLDVEFDAYALEVADGSLVVELSKGHIEKVGIGADGLLELLGRTGIGKVAASLTRNANLAASLLHLLHQKYRVTVACSRCGSHQAGGSGTYNYNVVHCMLKIFYKCTKLSSQMLFFFAGIEPICAKYLSLHIILSKNRYE